MRGPTTATAASARTARRIALCWAVATLAVAAASAPSQGIGRDESVYLVAAESYAQFWGELVRSPSRALAGLDRSFAVNHEHPALAKEVYGLAHALLAGSGLTSHLEGFRFGAFAFAALLSWLLAIAGFELAGTGGALLAPALFWAAPRHFYHAHPAALDLPITALWLATVLAYWRAVRGGDPPRGRLRAMAAAGLAFGAAISVKHNGWFLPPLLALHWIATRLPGLRSADGPMSEQAAPPLASPQRVGRRAVDERGACGGAAVDELAECSGGRILATGWRTGFGVFGAMAVLGPLVFVGSWPWLWHETLPRLREYLAFHLHHENYSWHYLGRVMREPPFPVEYPFAVTALTVPTAVLLVMAGGFVHGVARLALAVRPRPGEPGQGPERTPSAADELLLLLNALFPIVLIAWPTVPHFGGVKHWLPAMPFLALLGARAIIATGRTLWPARAGAVAAALSAFALVPAARAIAHVHPYGTATYNELAGGAAGAATLGMQRQFWGDNVVGLLPELNEHALPNARVWWQETTYLAVRAWQRDGRVRSDLRWADGPEEADLSIWQYHQEFRDKEFRTWTAFAEAPRPGERARLPRPVTGVYLDEVPLVVIYARPGAWR